MKNSVLPRFEEPPSALVLFLRAMLANPRRVGSICPSSSYLARSMAEHVPRDTFGLVVELGGGTGTVTRALLRRGINPERLVVIERCVKMSAYLRRSFPGIRVLQGDAAHLADLLGVDSNNVGVIVSSLPLRSLPRPTVNAIMAQVECVLKPQGLFIQYTYSSRASCKTLSHRFSTLASRIIWRNLPPARLDVFQCRVPL